MFRFDYGATRYGRPVRHARSSGVRYFSLREGLRDALQSRRIAHRWSDWRPEVPWMSLYFSAAVWLSLCLVLV